MNIAVFVHTNFATNVVDATAHKYLATTSNLGDDVGLTRYFEKWEEDIASIPANVEGFINIEIKRDRHGVASVDFHLEGKPNGVGGQFGAAGRAIEFNNSHIFNREPDLVVGFFC
ncbi:MAG: hypothetical protein G01um101420_440 [Parcubacteria group bacterium Gr01-1014_20]|nr:MAG: hypothetical protein G01um101420_440 [Parcubacteria group bacterium Gr01-1014_20]